MLSFKDQENSFKLAPLSLCNTLCGIECIWKFLQMRNKYLSIDTLAQNYCGDKILNTVGGEGERCQFSVLSVIDYIGSLHLLTTLLFICILPCV